MGAGGIFNAKTVRGVVSRSYMCVCVCVYKGVDS